MSPIDSTKVPSIFSKTFPYIPQNEPYTLQKRPTECAGGERDRVIVCEVYSTKKPHTSRKRAPHILQKCPVYPQKNPAY